MTIEYVDYADLRPNPFQPQTRWPVDPESVRELADDLRANGLIHTPVGRHAQDGTIQIGVGHRRITAWVIVWPDKPVPIDIRELTDRQMNESAARALLSNKKAARDHLRLMPVEAGTNKGNREYYHKQLFGSTQVLLGSTDKSFIIKRNEPNKSSGASKTAPPTDETPAQKAKREEREARERQAHREEKAALRRAKADVLWLLTNTAERMAPEVKASGGILDYCYELMRDQGYFNHQDWPEVVAFERDLESKLEASTGDVREDRLRMAILLGQLRRDIADYRPETEFDLARDTAIVSNTIGKTFQLSLPQGWHDVPVHKTDSNCHVCGRFTSLDHITQVDQAAGWRSEDGRVTCSDECRATIASNRAPSQPTQPKPKVKTAKQRRADYLKEINVVKRGKS